MTSNSAEVNEQATLEQPLKGQIAVVTGGSRGIGAAITRELAEKGATVALNYISGSESAEALVKEIESAGGIAFSFKADVSKQDEVKSFMEEVKERYGKIDILVNNAGITKDRTFRKLSHEDWNDVIDVNLNSVYNTTSSVIEYMLEQKYGRIINISSIIGQKGGFGQTNYSASKAGMIGFTKSLALETARSGITVNAICPGFVATEMVKAMPEKVLDSIIAQVPMQRLGEPGEIAETVVFLAQAKYITGQQINVNGGLYM